MTSATQTVNRPTPAEPRWNLAFVGILSYVFIEYTRLPAMYPMLQSIPVAKILAVLTLVGLLTAARPQRGQHPSSRSIDLAVLFFLLACVASALFSDWFNLQSVLGMVTWAVVYFLVSRTLTSFLAIAHFHFFLLLLLCLKLSQFEIRDYLIQQAFGRSASFLDQHGVGAGSTDFFGNGEDFGVAMCVVWPLRRLLAFSESPKSFPGFSFLCVLHLSCFPFFFAVPGALSWGQLRQH